MYRAACGLIVSAAGRRCGTSDIPVHVTERTYSHRSFEGGLADRCRSASGCGFEPHLSGIRRNCRPGNASLRVTVSKADSVTCNGPWHKGGVRVIGEGVRDDGPDGLDHLGSGFETRDCAIVRSAF